MAVPFRESDGSPEVKVTGEIAAADKEAFDAEHPLGSAHEFAAWLRCVDVQYVQPEDEQGDAPTRLIAVLTYQPDRDNSLFPDLRPPENRAN